MRKYLWIVLVFSLLLLTGGCSLGEQVENVKGRIPFVRDEELPCFDNIQDVKAYIRKEIEQGQKKIVLSTKELENQDFSTINESLDGYYGTVMQCEIKENILFSKKTITFTCDITDEYYVEEAIIRGQDIPSDRPEAEELASQCIKIRDAMMEDLGKDASDYEKELWIHDYLVSHTAYGSGNGQEETVHESYGALISHVAVCNGYAFAMKLLCDISSVECKLVVGEGDGEPHAWNLVKIDGQWYHVDVTWDDPTPDTEGRIVYTYFNVDDERTSLSHQWNTANYPKADSLKGNYYIRNGLYCKDYDEFKERCSELLEDGEQNQFQLMVGDYDPAIYSDENMKFIFEHTSYRSFAYQNLGEIPYMTIYIHLSN